MKRGRPLFLVVFTALLAAGAIVGRVSAQESGGEGTEKAEKPIGPRVEAIDPVYDFGKVYRGTVVQHTFTLRNAGDDVLKIEGIQKDCGCTVAKIEQQAILPGGEMDVDVKINTIGLDEGPLEKSVRIQTDDRGEPETILTMRGELMVTARMDPPSIKIEGIKPREEIPEQIVKIVPVEGYDLEIKEVESNSDFIHPRLLGRDDSGVYRVAIDIDTKTTKNIIAARIKALTNLEEEPVLRIPVQVVIDQPLVIVPHIIRFTGITPQYEGKLTYKAVIRNNREKPLKVLDVKSDNEFIECVLETVDPGKKYRLKVSLLPGFPEKGFESTVKIFTDNDMYPEREILVQVNQPPNKKKRSKRL